MSDQSPADIPFQLLKRIKPHHVKDYLTKRAHGRVDADLDRDEPKEHRSSTLEGDKRAILHYMPLNIPWDGTKGNPTRDHSVNSVINKVKVMECLGRGLPSQAVREFEDCEFVGIIDILRGFGDFVKSILTVTMMVLQFHICTRGDCMSKLRLSDLKSHAQFDFAMQLTVKWSKVAREER